MQDRRRIAKLMRDLEEIKAAVRRNSPILREILTARFYWWLVLTLGVAVVVFSVIMHFLVVGYGSYSAIPASLRATFWIVAAAAGVTLYVFRVRGVLSVIHAIDPRLTFWSFFGDHDIGEFFHLYGPFLLITVTTTIWLARTGNSFYIVGTWALCLGLTCNLIAFATHLLEYYVLGYAYMIAGALSFFIPGVSASLWTGICFGGGSVAYAAVSEVMRRGRRTREGGDG